MLDVDEELGHDVTVIGKLSLSGRGISGCLEFRDIGQSLSEQTTTSLDPS